MKKHFVIYFRQKQLIAERLSQLIKESGHSKGDIIRSTRISRKDLNRMLTGEPNLTVDSICMLLGALGKNGIEFMVCPAFGNRIRPREEEEKYVSGLNKELMRRESLQSAEE